jgi:two-component system NtrC family response regulator
VLSGYAWPGNVRELRNALERALVLATDTITAADLPERLHDASHRIRPALPNGADVRGQLAEVERAAIVAALDAENNNQTRAARRLGLSRRALIYKMEKYGLKAPPSREGSSGAPSPSAISPSPTSSGGGTGGDDNSGNTA